MQGQSRPMVFVSEFSTSKGDQVVQLLLQFTRQRIFGGGTCTTAGRFATCEYDDDADADVQPEMHAQREAEQGLQRLAANLAIEKWEHFVMTQWDLLRSRRQPKAERLARGGA